MDAMSKHSLKSKRRHPDANRERYEVAHITFEVSPEDKTFALIAGQALEAKERRPLFTGFVGKGMGPQLRTLAHRLEHIAAERLTIT